MLRAGSVSQYTAVPPTYACIVNADGEVNTIDRYRFIDATVLNDNRVTHSTNDFTATIHQIQQSKYGVIMSLQELIEFADAR